MTRLLWTTGFLLLSASAPAQGAPPPDGDREAAKEWANKAKERFDGGDYRGAIDGIHEAEKHARAPTLTRLSAQAHERLGRLLEAQRLYRSIVDLALAKDAPAAWLNAQEGARGELESITIRIPKLTIVVSGVELSGVEVRIDGLPLAPAQLGRPVPQDPGRHTIVVRAAAREAVTRGVELRESGVERVDIALAPPKPAPSVSAKAPPPAPPVTTGSSGVPRALPWVAFGVGGAGLIAGAITGGLVLAERGKLEASCTADLKKCTPGSQPGIEGLGLLADISTAGFIAGGVGVAAGAVLLLLPRPKPASVGVAVSPSGLSVWGAF